MLRQSWPLRLCERRPLFLLLSSLLPHLGSQAAGLDSAGISCLPRIIISVLCWDLLSVFTKTNRQNYPKSPGNWMDIYKRRVGDRSVVEDTARAADRLGGFQVCTREGSVLSPVRRVTFKCMYYRLSPLTHAYIQSIDF